MKLVHGERSPLGENRDTLCSINLLEPEGIRYYFQSPTCIEAIGYTRRLSIFRNKKKKRDSVFLDLGDHVVYIRRPVETLEAVYIPNQAFVLSGSAEDGSSGERELFLQLPRESPAELTLRETLLKIFNGGIERIQESEPAENQEPNDQDNSCQVVALFKGQDPPPLSERLARRMLEGAEGLANGLVQQAQARANAWNVKLDQMPGNHSWTNSGARPLNPKLLRTVKTAKVVANVAADLSTLAVGGICIGLSRLGTKFGPSLKDGTSKLLANLTKGDVGQVRARVDDFCNIAGGLVGSTGRVLSAVEESARILGPCVAKEIGQQVGKTHGEEYGELTEDALGFVGHTAVLGYNLKGFKRQVAIKGTPIPAKVQKTTVEDGSKN